MKIQFIYTVAGLLTCLGMRAQNASQRVEIPSKEAQITTALYAAPEDKKAEAKVYGYAQDGSFVVLREGTNDLVCLTDDPHKKDISSACYYVGLEPFMARSRELTAEGKSHEEKSRIRGEEVESGKLKIPQNSMLFVYTGRDADHNLETGEMKDGHLRYVVYIPFATTESTGLPDKPYQPGMPWLMDPGTYRAHIMITPAK